MIKKGCRVKFVAACNGDLGHHVHSREKVAAIRRQETLNAAKVLGLDSYDIYGWGDARCPNTIEAREMVARKIQEFEPDIVMTHRDCDYHVDHRTIGTLVKDGGYMLGCPHWIKGSKPLRRRPLSFLRFQYGISRRQELASFVETARPPRRRQIRMSGVETSSFGRLICGLSQMQG